MSILDQLSSRVGDRTQQANIAVAVRCVADPTLLAGVAEGLGSADAALGGDCAEVLTKVAEAHPELVAPFAERLAPLLAHRTTRVRWEATHALALVAPLAPGVMASLLPRLARMAREDPSTIVRDYAVNALGNHAGTGPNAARAVHPLVKEALTSGEGKQTHHALAGLAKVASAEPALRGELGTLAEGYLADGRATVRKAAKALLKASQGSATAISAVRRGSFS